jgi:hypothetical protein
MARPAASDPAYGCRISVRSHPNRTLPRAVARQAVPRRRRPGMPGFCFGLPASESSILMIHSLLPDLPPRLTLYDIESIKLSKCEVRYTSPIQYTLPHFDRRTPHSGVADATGPACGSGALVDCAGREWPQTDRDLCCQVAEAECGYQEDRHGKRAKQRPEDREAVASVVSALRRYSQAERRRDPTFCPVETRIRSWRLADAQLAGAVRANVAPLPILPKMKLNEQPKWR